MRPGVQGTGVRSRGSARARGHRGRRPEGCKSCTLFPPCPSRRPGPSLPYLNPRCGRAAGGPGWSRRTGRSGIGPGDWDPRAAGAGRVPGARPGAPRGSGWQRPWGWVWHRGPERGGRWVAGCRKKPKSLHRKEPPTVWVAKASGLGAQGGPGARQPARALLLHLLCPTLSRSPGTAQHRVATMPAPGPAPGLRMQGHGQLWCFSRSLRPMPSVHLHPRVRGMQPPRARPVCTEREETRVQK